MTQEKYAVISLSGGMDSSTLLLNLLAEGYNVTAVSHLTMAKNIK
jgi:7-cyano-7-deazaguanine synthase